MMFLVSRFFSNDGRSYDSHNEMFHVEHFDFSNSFSQFPPLNMKNRPPMVNLSRTVSSARPMGAKPRATAKLIDSGGNASIRPRHVSRFPSLSLRPTCLMKLIFLSSLSAQVTPI